MLRLYLKHQDLKYDVRDFIADRLRKLRDDESGAMIIDEVLLVVFIAVAIVLVVSTSSDESAAMFSAVR